MVELRRVPPGRAGRPWLRHRLDTARRAVDLLDRKLRILAAERERHRLLAEHTGADWRDRAQDAERWLVRGTALGGRRALRHATGSTPAELSTVWSSVMGVPVPVEVTCVLPEISVAAASPGNAALAEATAAYRRALEAAVRHAAAESAFRALDAEVAETRRRRHAVADRWLPSLEAAGRALAQRLEEDERAETVRWRWAASRREADR